MHDPLLFEKAQASETVLILWTKVYVYEDKYGEFG